jgi:osmotically-inducible protein OsmY
METSVSSIIQQICEALEKDPLTRKAVIEVGFNQGIVTLTGSVKSPGMIKAAEKIARSHPGVVSVVNELKVG